jgi:lysophospholipase L1-like esterase
VITMQNQVVIDLAQKHGLTLVDNFNLIPQDEKHFQDKIHFTSAGMREIAQNLASGVSPLLLDKFPNISGGQ